MSEDITFQLSLDLQWIDDAVALARIGVEAGVQAIEAGTILILSEGARSVLPRLKREFPDHPIVADIKCTDGAAYEMAMIFDLGATAGTVMASSSDASIRNAVREANGRPGCRLMVDTMGCGGADGRYFQGQIDAAKRAHDLGAHLAVLHLGYDERIANQRMVDDNLLLRWAEAVANADLGIPLQVVGGLTLAQAKGLPRLGITEIVISMNLGTAGERGKTQDASGGSRYDQVTGFTVDLRDPADCEKVSDQVRRFVNEVVREA